MGGYGHSIQWVHDEKPILRTPRQPRSECFCQCGERFFKGFGLWVETGEDEGHFEAVIFKASEGSEMVDKCWRCGADVTAEAVFTTLERNRLADSAWSSGLARREPAPKNPAEAMARGMRKIAPMIEQMRCSVVERVVLYGLSARMPAVNMFFHVTVSEVAEVTGMSVRNVQYIMRRLEAMGIVYVRHDHSRRGNEYMIVRKTDTGANVAPVTGGAQ